MKTALRLLSIGLLTATTGCFGWTENTIEHYCGCSKLRADARLQAHPWLEDRNDSPDSRPGEGAPRSKPSNRTYDPGHSVLDTAIASVAVPTVFVVETAATVTACALCIVLFPVVLYNWPTC